MYKELRPNTCRDSSSTPEIWAGVLADSSTRFGAYHRVVFRLDHRWQMIRRVVPPGGRILDAGCGAGEWVAFLNERGFAAEGLDYSPELVARTRAMYPAYQWKSGTVQNLPYESATFDAVISWGVIEHDEVGPQAALREFRRVLKDGGVVIVTVPVDTERQRKTSRSHFGDDRANGNHTFFQYFLTADELAERVAEAGFAVIEGGLQHSTAVTLLLPKLSARLSFSTTRILNKIVRVLLPWHRGIMNMTYCIGAAPPPR